MPKCGDRIEVQTFNTQQISNPNNRLLIHIGSYVCHQGEIFDQSTGFSFGRITGAKHTPLTRLQRSWAAHFAGLLEL